MLNFPDLLVERYQNIRIGLLLVVILFCPNKTFDLRLKYRIVVKALASDIHSLPPHLVIDGLNCLCFSCRWSDVVLWNPYLTMEACYKDFVCVENAQVWEVYRIKILCHHLVHVLILIANVSSGYGYFVTSNVVLHDLGFRFSKLDP
jgi:hypothetical protein